MTNLIEQLGGYDVVKKMWIDGGSLKDTQLAFELLEHRRQHNIYEIGDSIVTNDDASDGKVYAVEKNHFNEHFKIRSKDGFRYCRLWRIDRHATDKEIAQGYRDE